MSRQTRSGVEGLAELPATGSAEQWIAECDQGGLAAGDEEVVTSAAVAPPEPPSPSPGEGGAEHTSAARKIAAQARASDATTELRCDALQRGGGNLLGDRFSDQDQLFQSEGQQKPTLAGVVGTCDGSRDEEAEGTHSREEGGITEM